MKQVKRTLSDNDIILKAIHAGVPPREHKMLLYSIKRFDMSDSQIEEEIERRTRPVDSTEG